ncbi:helix-turn-helix domain-containing protein [Methylovulum psychrotolerans]|uniref:Helix-turn-helix domain-containing protein n=1 Tax=Methylovulum psychrotolerans TaxID=1704499 RepID=A0A2S5CIU6_9GAMM|nr:helix-turn-helix domain-containing protein [Methylovulum psychrotolerans]POZ50677.1 helix-turn-helix domain-containing protein [Methylovulum psychrotolerans]
MNKKSAAAVLDRLQQALSVESDSELSREIGINRATLGNWRNRNSIPYSLCINICEKENLSIDWLLTGEGEMFRQKSMASDNWTDNEMIASMLELLNEHQKREVFSVIKEKMRLNELELSIRKLLNK